MMPGSGAQARRLYVHVGLQKTGTSYLQGALLASRSALADQGVDLVPATKREAFELMLAVRGRYARERPEGADQQTLQRFAATLSAARGTTAVCSQESLAGATSAQVARFLAACGDREVHVVLTVRDLARQLPSSWQQALKANRTIPYEAYLRRLQSMEQAGSDRAPWVNLDPAGVLSRWSDSLPPGQVHVVTVPPRGSPITVLLERFCAVVGVDPSTLDPEDKPSNTSLGYAEAELLRRVNAELPDEVRHHQVYGDVGKRFFAAQVLRKRRARTILVPAEFRPWCDGVTERTIAALDQAGYDVTGSLDDLRGSDAAFATGAAYEPGDEEVASAAVSAIAEMLTLRGSAAAARRDGRIVARPSWQRRLRDLVPAAARRRLRGLVSRRRSG